MATPIEIITAIQTKKFGKVPNSPLNATVINPKILPSAFDLRESNLWAANNPTKSITEYVERYEPFEFRLTDGRPFAHILKGSIDYSDDNFLRFKTDTDTNDSIMVLGAPKRVYPMKNSTDTLFTDYIIVRTVAVAYNALDAIEYCCLEPKPY